VLFSNWKSAVSDLQDWLTKQEKKLAAQGDLAFDLESIRKQKITLEVSTSYFPSILFVLKFKV
jgi:hypothetical protein